MLLVCARPNVVDAKSPCVQRATIMRPSVRLWFSQWRSQVSPVPQGASMVPAAGTLEGNVVIGGGGGDRAARGGA